jgi:hypothetical protein
MHIVVSLLAIIEQLSATQLIKLIGKLHINSYRERIGSIKQHWGIH